MSNPRQGWRYFRCDECGFGWRETCRDATTESCSHCPKCHTVDYPIRHEVDDKVEVDRWGNLAHSEKIEEWHPRPGNMGHKWHELKIWPEYYGAVVCGVKTFEVRVNDRDFKMCDTVLLREWHPKTEQYTGEQKAFMVGYVLELGNGKVAFSLLSDDERPEMCVHGTDACRNCETGRITVYARHRWCVECLHKKEEL